MQGYPGIPQNLPQQFRCYNHPDREGVGICVGCRAVVCVECTTKIDRMNYCIRCLTAAQAPPAAVQVADGKRDVLLGIPLLVLSFAVAVGLFAVAGLVLAFLRSGAPGGIGG
jgi:hypothetical protein